MSVTLIYLNIYFTFQAINIKNIPSFVSTLILKINLRCWKSECSLLKCRFIDPMHSLFQFKVTERSGVARCVAVWSLQVLNAVSIHNTWTLNVSA